MSNYSPQRYNEYERFMVSHRQTVWQICFRFAKGDQDRCRDLVQEVYLTLWLKFDQLRDDASERGRMAWLRRVARNVLIDLHRKEKDAVFYDISNLPDIPENPHQDVLSETIEEMTELLSDSERQLVQMRLDGYNASEIASALNIKSDAVYQRFCRIIKKLKAIYGEQ